MNPLELLDDREEALRQLLEGHQASVQTAGPGIIQSFDPLAITCVVQPSVQALATAKDGSKTWVNPPLLVDCPVVFPSGGGATFTFPLSAGDECLLVFASRCIDAWHQSGGVQPQAEFRMHSLADGFAIPGVRSLTRPLSNVSTTSAQIRSDDGLTIIDLNPAAKTITLTAPNGATIDANIQVNGSIHATGTITSDTDVITGSVSLKNHIHPGVQSGSSNTGAATG